ncbi:DUF461 domain-containing protein [Streptomyces sp. F63]|uniref:DUF461 domain-containing protein n=1 Tax=Streptomyces sp. F63 TaxID=2824887 RepID=UPI001B35E6DF|nr:DUF461 domain-containing protein [Streptomyces sp. F63]MBQ0986666.1 DUF461 domain-containing protein [Streptomyces sp. F63]
MSRSLRRGILAATTVAISLLTVSACGAGNEAGTNQVSPDNASASVGKIKIQNVNVITQAEGSEGPAVVSAKIFNTGGTAQTLESVTVSRQDVKAELSPAKGSGPVTVPAHGSVILSGKGNAAAELESPEVEEGGVTPVVFTLSGTGDIKVDAVVMPADGYFERFGPSAQPTQSPTATPSKSPEDTESPSESETATESPAGDENAGAGTREDVANGDEEPQGAAGH